MTKTIKPVCSTCGSDDVLNDAYVSWDQKAQAWSIHQVFDKGAYCQDCSGETSITWIDIERRICRF